MPFSRKASRADSAKRRLEPHRHCAPHPSLNRDLHLAVRSRLRAAPPSHISLNGNSMRTQVTALRTVANVLPLRPRLPFASLTHRRPFLPESSLPFSFSESVPRGTLFHVEHFPYFGVELARLLTGRIAPSIHRFLRTRFSRTSRPPCEPGAQVRVTSISQLLRRRLPGPYDPAPSEPLAIMGPANPREQSI